MQYSKKKLTVNVIFFPERNKIIIIIKLKNGSKRANIIFLSISLIKEFSRPIFRSFSQDSAPDQTFLNVKLLYIIVGDVQGLRDYQSKSSKSLQSQSSILHDCLRSEDSAKTPCIEESETTALVFLLKEYWSPDWSPKQGRVGCGRQNLYRITAFDSI